MMGGSNDGVSIGHGEPCPTSAEGARFLWGGPGVLPRKIVKNQSRMVAFHYDDVIMTTLASQITSLTVVYLIVYSGLDESKHQSSASLAFVHGI